MFAQVIRALDQGLTLLHCESTFCFGFVGAERNGDICSRRADSRLIEKIKEATTKTIFIISQKSPTLPPVPTNITDDSLTEKNEDIIGSRMDFTGCIRNAMRPLNLIKDRMKLYASMIIMTSA